MEAFAFYRMEEFRSGLQEARKAKTRKGSWEDLERPAECAPDATRLALRVLPEARTLFDEDELGE